MSKALAVWAASITAGLAALAGGVSVVLAGTDRDATPQPAITISGAPALSTPGSPGAVPVQTPSAGSPAPTSSAARPTAGAPAPTAPHTADATGEQGRRGTGGAGEDQGAGHGTPVPVPQPSRAR